MTNEEKYAVLPDGVATFYCVQVFRRWSSLSVLGLPLAGDASAPGCEGFIPVFKTLAEAKAWRDENHPRAGIVGMAYGKDVAAL